MLAQLTGMKCIPVSCANPLVFTCLSATLHRGDSTATTLYQDCDQVGFAVRVFRVRPMSQKPGHWAHFWRFLRLMSGFWGHWAQGWRLFAFLLSFYYLCMF